jgi:L-threonylcarbamoyladenylate synthase
VDLTRAADAIRRGGVVAYPTEAVFGLGCDPRSALAVERILAMKGRPRELGLILIASVFVHLAPYLQPLAADVEARAGATWPGPVTWIWPARADVPAWLTGGRDTLAVRVTAHPTAAALCHAAGMAIVSTSANPHGKPPARNAVEAETYFGKALNAIVDAPVGELERPTEIRDIRTGAVLRVG